MSKTLTRRAKRSQDAIAAQNRREQRAAEHAKQTAQHAKRRDAIALYEAAFSAWCESGKIGPAPLNPRHSDRALFPENFR